MRNLDNRPIATAVALAWAAHNLVNVGLLKEVAEYPVSLAVRIFLMALRVVLPFGAVGLGYAWLALIPLAATILAKHLARDYSLSVGWRLALPLCILTPISAVLAPATGMHAAWSGRMVNHAGVLAQDFFGSALLTFVLYATANAVSALASRGLREWTRR